MRDDLPDDYTSVKRFHEQLPSLHVSEEALRWELRFRKTNGLLADGVVVERKADPKASRAALLISPSRYLQRLKRMSRAAVA